MSSTDRIEQSVVIAAPRARVWRALTDSAELGRWFGVEIDGPFVAGQRSRGRLTVPGYEHVIWDVEIDRIEPEHLFSWRWHPYAIDPLVDYSSEVPTTVVFELDEVPGGTRLTVVESGFDAVPAARREGALRMNQHGWAEQTKAIERHVLAG
jgi:uncharacterized protein YndB with AHSA1/START domain